MVDSRLHFHPFRLNQPAPGYGRPTDTASILLGRYLQSDSQEQSRHNHQLAYRQIPILKDYNKIIFFARTIVHWNALTFYIPVLPTVAQLRYAVCQVVPQLTSLRCYNVVLMLRFGHENFVNNVVSMFL